MTRSEGKFMHSRFFSVAMAALLSFGLIGSAAAHSVWIEREGDGARIYFGEFDENLRRGGYVIEVQHTDATPGKLGEEAYDSVRCASTLFVRAADGLQGPSQPAVTTPKRY
jgi:hypothetical protein